MGIAPIKASSLRQLIQQDAHKSWTLGINDHRSFRPKHGVKEFVVADRHGQLHAFQGLPQLERLIFFVTKMLITSIVPGAQTCVGGPLWNENCMRLLALDDRNQQTCASQNQAQEPW